MSYAFSGIFYLFYLTFMFLLNKSVYYRALNDLSTELIYVGESHTKTYLMELYNMIESIANIDVK